MIPHKQLKLADIFKDCKNICEESKSQFLSLLEEPIDLSEYMLLVLGYQGVLQNFYCFYSFIY